ncbi:MAG TPA: pyridoxamine 5'-phosphate oxidase family protein [Methanoculleus sp.]|jgi:predicted pyridoxine 5'-phosphate oxidase superfamily flavin-nucleotide-binding protein|nr:pyridoxamine 5'-phosphate oxidase family protein [Methanoculleus sp.]MBP8675456.1 pyridoxamine 5'-phosphate oxidase family protein [Methanoculleus sp.]HOB07302.1 pyridoxamine 5'-phosphate oxidase family protein [Methanoculleus sp.]HON39847.1 pyridoxamine 5'-phosphate oxidase family protein [Methanoculleus sp.]HPD52266.1 pyridoxamine 5'-phosphate oxidase family protein [Methanoculleus sp.]
MVALTEEMKAAFRTMKAYPVATASKEGWPNVVPIAFVEIVDDETIWIADNYMKKTLANVQENPRVAIYIWGPETKGCFQIKGDVEIRTSGPEFEKMQFTVRSKMAKAPAKTLLIMKIREVYECTPGSRAGEKIL